ncbi:Metallophos domain-containing protein [Abeliophyllum distichum]|uniref:Metallophos domain-containing protein n=1 Tax=Abeliophyllum distichum TaxID=126358 RepID=A0ABD1V6P2_9LAMI
MALCLYSACLPLRQQPGNANFSYELDFINRRSSIITPSRVVMPQILPSVQAETIGSRVFVVSDLHTDYFENMMWVRYLSSNRYKKDVLIVAGDVAETCGNFVLTMSLLRESFRHVFFVPGNHDLWLRREKHNYFSSLDKLDKLLYACERLGVETKPSIVDGLGIIPLYSWYHESFDEERDITGIRIPSLEMACKDFHVCRWPDGLKNGETLALYFDCMNDKNWNTVKDIQRRCSHIVSFSHFLPRLELCPEKRMLFYPNLPKIIGSKFLETRIRSIHGDAGKQSTCHVFGHTHFCWDTILDGIRYVQAPLAYPKERKRRMNGGEDWLPFCIYADGRFAEKLSPCYWSDYYAVNPRTPNCTQLAPWVARFYAKTL